MPVRLLTTLFLGALLALLPGAPVQASAGFNVGVAYVDEIEGESSQALTLGYLTQARHPWEFMAGHIRSRDRGGPVATPGVNFLSASKRFTWRGWFAQGGIAWTDSDTEVLSKNWQFMTGAGYGFERWTLSLRHLSNANSGGRNRGENLLIVEYGF